MVAVMVVMWEILLVATMAVLKEPHLVIQLVEK